MRFGGRAEHEARIGQSGTFNSLDISLDTMAESLAELSQRTEAFWIGVALFLLGVATPETLLLGGIDVSRTLIWVGGGILVVRILVGIFRILSTAVEAGVSGYREGRQNDR